MSVNTPAHRHTDWTPEDSNRPAPLCARLIVIALTAATLLLVAVLAISGVGGYPVMPLVDLPTDITRAQATLDMTCSPFGSLSNCLVSAGGVATIP